MNTIQLVCGFDIFTRPNILATLLLFSRCDCIEFSIVSLAHLEQVDFISEQVIVNKMVGVPSSHLRFFVDGSSLCDD